MSKNKHDKNTSIDFDTIADRAQVLSAHVGLAACSLAALAGLVEIHNEGRQPKYVEHTQPLFGNHEQVEQQGHHLDMRKEKEEIKHATISYGATMRSHPISGTL